MKGNRLYCLTTFLILQIAFLFGQDTRIEVPNFKRINEALNSEK